MIAFFRGKKGASRGQKDPGPLSGPIVPCGHVLHKQKSYKVTFKKVHSVPGAQARQGRALGQNTQLLTLGAPGNFLFVGGARWATGHKLWARQKLASLHLEQDRGLRPLNQGANGRIMRCAGFGGCAYSSP